MAANAPTAARELLDSYIPETWTPGHQAEADFLRDKRRDRRVQSMIEGVLLPTEIDEGLIISAAHEEDRRVASLRTRLAAKEQLMTVLAPQPPTLADFQGKSVYIPDGLFTSHHQEALALALQGFGSMRVTQVHLAQVMVVEDVGRLPVKLRCVASLEGAWVVTPKAFCLLPGPALKFHVAVVTHRTVWATNAFVSENPGIYEVIQAAGGGARRPWKFLSAQDWATARARAELGNRTASIIALLSTPEAAQCQEPHMYDLSGFLEFVGKMDRSRCTMG